MKMFYDMVKNNGVCVKGHFTQSVYGLNLNCIEMF